MFYGSYEYSVDEKGRLNLPKKMRDGVGNQLFLLKGYDGCISLYKEEDFKALISKLSTLQFESKEVRLYQRMLLQSVVEIKVDNLNRMAIPLKTLSEYKIGNKVLILGVLDHIEVWDLEKWNEYKGEHIEDFEKDAEAIIKSENK